VFNKRKRRRLPRIHTLIGAQTRIDGDVEFGAGGLHLDGRINGNVTGDAELTATLVVSEQGCIDGSVKVANVILYGVVKGDLEVARRVELGPKARVLGNVSYETIETAVGAQINGQLIHRTPAGPTDAPTGGAAGDRAASEEPQGR
jgi:cytoskeletal protein CcmA (bactofilin family)